MPTKRLYFLDNLKWFIIWLMTVFHAAMCYMAYAPEWWYVVDTAQPVFSATVFILWVDIFIMLVMFFISGYFGLMSLTKHGAGTFWRKKIGRIAVPWVFGSMVFAPLVTYIILASRHAPVDFWTFYTTPLLTNLSATSYPVYYLHMEVLFPVAWLFTTLPGLNVYLKYIVVCALTLGICYVFSKYILLRIPCFGGTRK